MNKRTKAYHEPHGLVTAEQLKHKKFNNAVVTTEVHKILRDIDISITNAHSVNENIAIFAAPADFAFPAMSNKDSQLIVYYRLIRSLEARGFYIDVEIRKGDTLFYIEWESEFDENERVMMMEIISEHKRTT